MKVITGIRPTSNLTIANLIGAVMPLLDLQKSNDEILVFVATMHGLTDKEPKEVFQNVKEIVKDYLALGLDPQKVTIFDQKDIKEEVALMKLYLERLLTVARACRVPTLKDKLKEGQTPEQASVMLMGYPIMMTADIVLQDAEIVPVGKDQYPHIELACELVDAFNKKYGKGKKVLIRPSTLEKENPINILALFGEGKMSKTRPEAAIFLTDSKEIIKKKIDRAETALEGEMTEKLQNLIQIAKILSPNSEEKIAEIISRHLKGEKVMGELKKLLTEIITDFTLSFQKKRDEIKDSEIDNILREGKKVSQVNARRVIERVEKALGII